MTKHVKHVDGRNYGCQDMKYAIYFECLYKDACGLWLVVKRQTKLQ